MNGLLRGRLVALGLVLTILGSIAFAVWTSGFYGTSFGTLAEALAPPKTVAESDDVYLCRSLNGEGSDDNLSIGLLRLLLPLLVWRVWRLLRGDHKGPRGGEAVAFLLLSSPALLFYFGMSTCSDLMLTLIVGRNVALAVCLLGWLLSAVAYLWPARTT